MDEIEQNNEKMREEEIQPSSGRIEEILPTTNEDEMKKLMQELDREQAYREHKCWRQYITVIVSFVFVEVSKPAASNPAASKPAASKPAAPPRFPRAFIPSSTLLLMLSTIPQTLS